MARRYHEIKGLAEFTAKTIVSSEEDWKKFLHTAGHKPKLWKMEEEHKDYVIDSLERIYGETDASRSFENRIMELANRIASTLGTGSAPS